jgi:hypothetical protein
VGKALAAIEKVRKFEVPCRTNEKLRKGNKSSKVFNGLSLSVWIIGQRSEACASKRRERERKGRSAGAIEGDSPKVA